MPQALLRHEDSQTWLIKRLCLLRTEATISGLIISNDCAFVGTYSFHYLFTVVRNLFGGFAIISPMNYLTYLEGDVATPQSIGPQIIAHICTESGTWHRPIAESIFREWPMSKRRFLQWYRDRNQNDFGLGSVQFVNGNRTHVNRLVRIANMIATRGRGHMVRYRALTQCLNAVAKKSLRLGATVHLPFLGPNQTDSWPNIEQIIHGSLCRLRIRVFVYKPKPVFDEKMFSKVIKPRPRKRFDLFQFRAEYYP